MLAIVVRAFCWVGVVALLRALPWPSAWPRGVNWKTYKPLSCDACMVLWAGAETLTFWAPVAGPWPFLELGASYGLAWWLVHVARGLGPAPVLGDIFGKEK